MSRPDLGSNTEHDAGLYERAMLEPVDKREHDEPGPRVEHDCTSPDPEKCLLCVLEQVVAEQNAAGYR